MLNIIISHPLQPATYYIMLYFQYLSDSCEKMIVYANVYNLLIKK